MKKLPIAALFISVLILGFGHNAEAKVVFTKDLSAGLRADSDVQALQTILNQDGFLTSDNITGNFGPVTQAAVQAFQAANGINSTGFVGPVTRAKLLDNGPDTTTGGANPSTGGQSTDTNSVTGTSGGSNGSTGTGSGGSSNPSSTDIHIDTTFDANPKTFGAEGGSTQLTWNAPSATPLTCYLLKNANDTLGNVPVDISNAISGSKNILVNKTTVFTLNCTGKNGTPLASTLTVVVDNTYGNSKELNYVVSGTKGYTPYVTGCTDFAHSVPTITLHPGDKFCQYNHIVWDEILDGAGLKLSHNVDVLVYPMGAAGLISYDHDYDASLTLKNINYGESYNMNFVGTVANTPGLNTTYLDPTHFSVQYVIGNASGPGFLNGPFTETASDPLYGTIKIVPAGSSNGVPATLTGSLTTYGYVGGYQGDTSLITKAIKKYGPLPCDSRGTDATGLSDTIVVQPGSSFCMYTRTVLGGSLYGTKMDIKVTPVDPVGIHYDFGAQTIKNVDGNGQNIELDFPGHVSATALPGTITDTTTIDQIVSSSISNSVQFLGHVHQNGTGLLTGGITIQSAGTQASTPSVSSSLTSGSVLISKDLSIGLKNDSDVITLQTVLSKDGFLTSDNITGNFGPVTQAAVQAFQTASGINPTGTVGPMTRVKLSQNVPNTVPTSPVTTPAVTQTPVPTLNTTTVQPAAIQTNSCAAPLSVSQVVPCLSGQTGSMTQVQTKSAYPSCTFGAWSTVSSNCAVIATSPTPVSLTPPTGLTASAGACNSGNMTLSWNPVMGAAYYNVTRSSSPGGPYGSTAGSSGISGTSFTDTQLGNSGITWYYEVQAVNGNNVSPNSSPASAAGPSICRANNCTDGNTQNLSCPSGQTGFIVQTCSLGNWNTVLTNCSVPQVGQAPVVTLTANPTISAPGWSATLSWTSTNSPTSCTWNNGLSALGTYGSRGVGPTQTTTYTVTCTNSTGSGSASATITVTPTGANVFDAIQALINTLKEQLNNFR